MDTINPYLSSGKTIALRLLWDMNYKSWISRSRLDEFRNSAMGKKAVILCNGPSLNKVDFDLLNGVKTFGLNKINLIFSRVKFRPNFIVSINDLVIEQNKKFLNQTNTPIFINSSKSGTIDFRSNVVFLHASNQHKFAKNCRISINPGYTVTYVALQLAYHMGFTDVALVGCDHTFAVKGPANKTEVAQGPDLSHFDPNYFSGGMSWQLPDLLMSEWHYQLAKETFQKSNRRIVNCTEGGKLDIFERMSLEKWLHEEKYYG